MDRTEAINLFDAIVNSTIEYRRDHGEVPMSFVLALPDNELVHVPAPPGFDAGDMAEVIRGMADQMGARYVLSIGEAWVSVRKQVEGVRPSLDPDRTEAILVSIDGPDIERLAMIEIRPDGSFAEPTIEDTFMGRMANLSGMVGIN